MKTEAKIRMELLNCRNQLKTYRELLVKGGYNKNIIKSIYYLKNRVAFLEWVLEE